MASLACATGSQISFSCPTDGACLALSVGQENKFWDAFSGVCGAVILGLFKYVKVLTNLILFWAGDSACQVLASQGCTVCIPNKPCKLILIRTFQFQLLLCFD